MLCKAAFDAFIFSIYIDSNLLNLKKILEILSVIQLILILVALCMYADHPSNILVSET